tara:strand:+ start:417 stop:1070 length:654 start_codon:yes stop_codon:yes gene_type:complete
MFFKKKLSNYDSLTFSSPNLMFFNKKDYWSYFEEGYSKYESDDYEGAIDDFTNSIEKKSDFEKSYYWRAQSKYELDDFEGAIDDLTKAIEIRSEYADAFYSRGNSKTHLDDFEGAIDDFTKAIEIRFEFVDAYGDRGRCKAQLDDFEGFQADFKKAIELASKYSSSEELNILYGDFYYCHAIFKNEKEDFKGAKNDLTIAASYGSEEAKKTLLTYDI